MTKTPSTQRLVMLEFSVRL